MQGFFIHVSNGAFPVSGQLSVNNNARNTNPSVVFLGVTRPDGPAPLLRLRAGFADETTLSDPFVIYLKDGATAAFDKNLDALKLMNTHTGVPNLYAISTDTARLSIQALPYPESNLQVIPLGLTTAQNGWVTFRIGDILQMPSFLHIYLSDTRSGIDQELGQGGLYRLYLAKGSYEGRFFLKFSPTVLNSTPNPPGEPFDVYNSAGNIVVRSNLPAGVHRGLLVFNLAGQLIYRGEITDNAYHIINMPPIATGIYVVSLNDGHKMYSKKIVVGKQP